MKEQRVATLTLTIAVALLLGANATAQPRPRELLVAAAASLSDVMPQVATAFHAQTAATVRFNFGGSQTLARQIVEGARADVFLSADPKQMDVVAQADRLLPDTRVDLLSNQLVIAVPVSSPIAEPHALTLPAVKRIAMGDPAAVPAGVYARQWLEAIRLWPSIASKVVPLQSSRAALAAVRAGRAEAGIVYITDLHGEHELRIAHAVSGSAAPRIVYPVAAVRGGREDLAREFIAFLRSARARDIFTAAGFRTLVAP